MSLDFVQGGEIYIITIVKRIKNPKVKTGNSFGRGYLNESQGS